jgi:hypothetical protein
MTAAIPSIRNALTNALDAMTPAMHTVHQGESFSPDASTPYQEAYLLPAQPDNSTLGSGFYQERGIFQVTLKYPLGIGTLAAETRAEMIRDLFARGATFSDGGVTVQIDATPQISQGARDDDRWAQVVRVRWHADIFK